MNKKEIKMKVEEMLENLSLSDKLGQLNQEWGFAMMSSEKNEELIRRGMVGSMLYVPDVKKRNELQRLAVEQSPAGIPILFAQDVCHGYKTLFPISLAMASSFEPEVVERAQSIAAREARADGIAWTFYPMLDVGKDLRWGRIIEGNGEDPYLASKMAAAHVRGFQGSDLSDGEHILACAKHFAGYALADGGRDYDPVDVSEAQLYNIVFPPFKAAIKEGVGTVMSAYMDLNNVPASANKWLITDVLKKEWGFEGFVVTDANCISGMVTEGKARTNYDAAESAMKAGVDMDMGSEGYLGSLTGLLEEGKVSMEQIDDAVRRILTVKFELGLFDNPYTDENRLSQVAFLPSAREEARRAAAKSMVLLKNKDQILPLSKELKKIAVVGPLADDAAALESMGVSSEPQAVTVLQGIRNKLPETEIVYEPGPWIKRTGPSPFSDIFPDFAGKKQKAAQTAEEADEAFARAVAAGKDAEVIIAVMGETDDMSCEASSRAMLDLPQRQEELLKALYATGKPVILVIVSGRPLSIVWAKEHIPAILHTWQSGWEGGNATADVLFGDFNPAGRLPVTVPRSAQQEPMTYIRNMTHSPEMNYGEFRSRYWDEDSRPLFPFGYGLSYTKFTYSNLRLSSKQIDLGDTISIMFDITNTGDRDGEEVAQLYIHQTFGTESRPMRLLKGFERIALRKGETKSVTFTLGREELTYWSSVKHNYIQDATIVQFWIGGSSVDEAISGSFTVGEPGEEKKPKMPELRKQAAQSYSDEATIGSLLANPVFHTIFEKYVPELLMDENAIASFAGINLPMLLVYLPSQDLKERMQKAIEEMKQLKEKKNHEDTKAEIF